MDELGSIEISIKDLIESKFGSDFEDHLGMLCSLIPEFIHVEKFGADSVMLITPSGDSERMLEDRHGHRTASRNMEKRLISTQIKDMHNWIAKLGRSEMSIDEQKHDIIFCDPWADDRKLLVFLVPQWISKDPENNPNTFCICRENTEDAKIKHKGSSKNYLCCHTTHVPRPNGNDSNKYPNMLLMSKKSSIFNLS
ncbi:hypothetical protein ACE6H2_025944 [Prunus campanulata]